MSVGDSRAVLVTGGAGYIGSHACKALAQADYIPVTVDNFVNGFESAVRWGPLECADIGDRVRLDEVFRVHQPVAVMHFAAYAYVGESMKDPGNYYRNNVVNSLTLLEAARDHGVKRFVFSSTCNTYGVPRVTPITEEHVQLPINPYGASKLMVERILRDFDSSHGIRSISLRYFNAAGADPDLEIGEDHDPETHLIPLVLMASAVGAKPLEIYGDDYETPDGTCVRDYIHVTDLAAAHLLALKRLEQGGESNAYNLGNGSGFSVRDVIRTAEGVTGHAIPVRTIARRPGDAPILVGDATKARHELGWRPGHAELSYILETAWGWHCRQGRDDLKTSVG
ncbi:MAG: UDP-glucose 4-epimerase GalE [marine bacterium B5-7]|nr:MAG: UDP-glucose 4-epimerase GalE [marine bacterium B5-7]